MRNPKELRSVFLLLNFRENEGIFRIYLGNTVVQFVFKHCSSRKVEEDDFEDSTANQKWVMSPKTHDTDVTLLLNKLLREYDKKLRPDIGSKSFSL